MVSGRTTYGDETAYRRVLSVLDRAFDDLGHAGPTIHVSNNGALYRTQILRQFPYPPTASPFQSARLRMAAMLERGHRFYFEPRATMRHALGGWNFIRDYRQNTGYSDMMSHPRRHLTAIPSVFWQRRRWQLADCGRVGSRDLEWYDWPPMLCLLALAPCLEIPGMLDAILDRPRIPRSAYR